jgi:hypothetical protein
MTDLTYEKLLRRYRHMLVDSGVAPQDISNAGLIKSLKAESHEDQIKAMKVLISLVPETYWRAQGL